MDKHLIQSMLATILFFFILLGVITYVKLIPVDTNDVKLCVICSVLMGLVLHAATRPKEPNK